MKNKGLLIVIAIVILLAIIVVIGYNGLVTKSENVDNKFADIDVMLQRRADLIPNLVSTVKGFTSHEDAAIKAVTDARTKLVGAGTVQEKADANAQLSSSLNSLLVIVENYPDIKSSQNFIQLSDELAGTENRIATARRDYNDAVKTYNASIKKVPTNIFAGMFGFDEKDYFTAKEGSDVVPNVEF